MEKGEQKYLKEFDVEYFAHTMRKVHVLLSSMLNDKKRFLTNYQQFHVLRLQDEEDLDGRDDDQGEDNDREYEQVPKSHQNSRIDRKTDKIMVSFPSYFLE